MKHYLKLVLVFISTGLFLLIAFSYWLDPYGIYLHSSDTFPRKIAAADKGRTVKPYQVMHAAPYTLLIGNSRIELGMPFEHPFYQDKPVYNMGLPGAGITMQYDYAKHAIANNDSIKQIVIALDFLDFSSRANHINTQVDNSSWRWRLTSDDNAKSLTEKRHYYAEKMSLLFSLTAITDNIGTVFLQNNNVNALSRFGFNDGKLYQFHVAAEGFGALYQQKAEELDNSLSNKQLVFAKSSYHLNELDNFLDLLKQNNITVFLLINPYQKPYLDKIKQHQLDSHFIVWKQELASLAAQHQLMLFDYAIRSHLVNKVVSAQSRDAEDSPYFWEPAHYRPAFGSLILQSFSTKNCNKLCHIYNSE